MYKYQEARMVMKLKNKKNFKIGVLLIIIICCFSLTGCSQTEKKLFEYYPEIENVISKEHYTELLEISNNGSLNLDEVYYNFLQNHLSNEATKVFNNLDKEYNYSKKAKCKKDIKEETLKFKIESEKTGMWICLDANTLETKEISVYFSKESDQNFTNSITVLSKATENGLSYDTKYTNLLEEQQDLKEREKNSSDYDYLKACIYPYLELAESAYMQQDGLFFRFNYMSAEIYFNEKYLPTDAIEYYSSYYIDKLIKLNDKCLNYLGSRL